MGSFVQNQFLNRANVVSRCKELEKLFEAKPVVARARFQWSTSLSVGARVSLWLPTCRVPRLKHGNPLTQRLLALDLCRRNYLAKIFYIYSLSYAKPLIRCWIWKKYSKILDSSFRKLSTKSYPKYNMGIWSQKVMQNKLVTICSVCILKQY